MSIFSRTRDIMAANFTELLDRSEDPSRMIRMIILEMEETLVEVRSTAARSIADAKEMRRAMVRLEGITDSWTEKAELALSTSEARLDARVAESTQLYEDARHATDDLREANQHMVSATIRAQELTEKVEAALTRSEDSERDLRAAVAVLGQHLQPRGPCRDHGQFGHCQCAVDDGQQEHGEDFEQHGRSLRRRRWRGDRRAASRPQSRRQRR